MFFLLIHSTYWIYITMWKCLLFLSYQTYWRYLSSWILNKGCVKNSTLHYVFCMYNLKTVWQSLLKAQCVLFQFSCRCRKLRTIFCYTLAVGHFEDYKKNHRESIKVYLHRDLVHIAVLIRSSPAVVYQGPLSAAVEEQQRPIQLSLPTTG